ncbi:MAG: hypothetical protein F4X99_20370 [Gammaproteobacteria bacterium]|nr:hypothetical protein [Gammaproteobacteria bacterium]
MSAGPLKRPLGFYNLCLQTECLDETVSFYRELGFVPTGEDAPGLRVSLAQGADVLTFMTFLEGDVINFRGAHIHKLMTELRRGGVRVTGYNIRADQQPLAVDEAGVPLPENECGHFTVYDPDGHELFFNTHPWERTPFEAAMGAGPRAPGGVVYCVHVADLAASQAFYETLGLRVAPDAGGAWVTPHARHEAIHFALRLRAGASAGPTLVLQWEAEDDRVPEPAGFVARGDGRWVGKDPDGRVLELAPTIGQ